MLVPTPRIRLLLSFTLCFVVGAGILSFHAAARQTALAGELLVAQARSIANNIAALSRYEVAANDRIALATRLESANDFQLVRTIVISDRREVPLAAVRRNVAGNLSATQGHDLTPPERGAAPLRSVLGLVKDKPVVVIVPIGEIAPIGWVHLEYEVTPLVTAQRRMLVDVALFLVLMLAAAVILFWFCIKSIVASPPGTTPGAPPGPATDEPLQRTQVRSGATETQSRSINSIL